MNLLCIKVHAFNPARNIYRFYTIRMGRDLFGTCIMMIAYGRFGTRGREKKIVCTSLLDAHNRIQKILHKRFNARPRIGVNYTTTFVDIDAALLHLKWENGLFNA